MNCRVAHQDRVKGYLTVEELHQALQCWIILAQKDAFLEERSCSSKGKELSIHSNLRFLSPFLDNGGVFRVGGRLKNIIFTRQETSHTLANETHI
jgi:hypothetical protein